MLVVQMACVAAPMVAVMVLPGCSAAKPKPAALRILPKAKKPSPPPSASEEYELDDGIDYGGGPAVFRKNLPLAGTKWEWEGNLGQDPPDTPGHASRYRLEFKPNGWFDFQADCKHGAGIYEIEGQRIALAVIKASHRTCRDGSLADDFLSALEGAKSYRQADSKLYFDLRREAKTMVFGIKP